MMPEPNAPNPNSEEQLQLEQVRLERIAAESELLTRQQELDAAKQRILTQHEDRLLAEAIRTGPRFHPDRNMLIKLLRDPENGLQFDGDEVTALHAGQRIPLSVFLDKFAEERPYLVDGRSLRGIQHRKEEADKPVKARSEMSLSEKIAFLDQPGGLAKWEALPAHPVRMVPLDQLDLATFSKLPRETKTRLISENPNLVEELARRGRR